MSDIHARPLDHAEHPESRDCPCGPTVMPVAHEDGTLGRIYVHHSMRGPQPTARAADIAHEPPTPPTEGERMSKPAQRPPASPCASWCVPPCVHRRRGRRG